MHNKSSEVCIKTRSTPASLPFRGQVTKPTNVKWSIDPFTFLIYIGRLRNVQRFKSECPPSSSQSWHMIKKSKFFIFFPEIAYGKSRNVVGFFLEIYF